jgi:hypothetical protein
MRTFGVFKGLLHPCDVGFQEPDALGVGCNDQGRYSPYPATSSLAFLSWKGWLAPSKNRSRVRSSRGNLGFYFVANLWREVKQMRRQIAVSCLEGKRQQHASRRAPRPGRLVTIWCDPA